MKSPFIRLKSKYKKNIIDFFGNPWYNEIIASAYFRSQKNRGVKKMDTEKSNKVHSTLDEATKQAIKQTWNIDVDGEIMSPLVDYVFKRIFTADDANS